MLRFITIVALDNYLGIIIDHKLPLFFWFYLKLDVKLPPYVLKLGQSL